MTVPVRTLDIARIRADFPILARTVRDGKPLVYLDSGATSKRPVQVLDAEREFLATRNASFGRPGYDLRKTMQDRLQRLNAMES